MAEAASSPNTDTRALPPLPCRTVTVWAFRSTSARSSAVTSNRRRPDSMSSQMIAVFRAVRAGNRSLQAARMAPIWSAWTTGTASVPPFGRGMPAMGLATSYSAANHDQNTESVW